MSSKLGLYSFGEGSSLQASVYCIQELHSGTQSEAQKL